MLSKSSFKECCTNFKAKGARNVPHSQEDRTLFEAGSKMNNYVSTVPARRERIEVRTRQKTNKNEEKTTCESKPPTISIFCEKLFEG